MSTGGNKLLKLGMFFAHNIGEGKPEHAEVPKFFCEFLKYIIPKLFDLRWETYSKPSFLYCNKIFWHDGMRRHLFLRLVQNECKTFCSGTKDIPCFAK